MQIEFLHEEDMEGNPFTLYMFRDALPNGEEYGMSLIREGHLTEPLDESTVGVATLAMDKYLEEHSA